MYKYAHKICIAAATIKNLDVLDLVCEKYRAYFSVVEVCEIAADDGSLEILKWVNDRDELDRLLYNDSPLSYRLYFKAAMKGHFDIIKYLYENECIFDELACNGTSQNGNLQMLKWLRDRGCPWDKSVCTNSAFFGYLDCLQYASENGCPWEAKTCFAAAASGQLDCLCYAHEHGCPWDWTKCMTKTEQIKDQIKKLQMLDYLEKHKNCTH